MEITYVNIGMDVDELIERLIKRWEYHGIDECDMEVDALRKMYRRKLIEGYWKEFDVNTIVDNDNDNIVFVNFDEYGYDIDELREVFEEKGPCKYTTKDGRDIYIEDYRTDYCGNEFVLITQNYIY